MATQSRKPAGDGPADPMAGLFDNEFVNSLRGSAQQVWLAGLGALAKAQAEGGKVFEQLVEEGTTLQRRTQAAAEEKIAEVGERVSQAAGGMGARAGQSWDKFESIFEERTSKALARLGVPSARQLQALEDRVDALSAELARLSQRVAQEPATVPRRTAAKKTAAKSAAPAPRPKARKRAL